MNTPEQIHEELRRRFSEVDESVYFGIHMQLNFILDKVLLYENVKIRHTIFNIPLYSFVLSIRRLLDQHMSSQIYEHNK